MFKGRKSLVFVTKHSGKYSVWLHQVGVESDPGVFANFEELAELRAFLDPVLVRPLSASLY